MDKIFRSFFAMRWMTVALIVFLLAIGAATFLESIYDIQTAKIIVYNAKWFEFLLVYLAFSLMVNIFRFEMYKREKIAVLLFHVSFIVILIGAAITRYISFEGLMIIKEGQQSNFIYSSDPHLWFRINDGKKQYTLSRQLFLSEVTNNDFEIDVDFPGHGSPITINYIEYQKNMIDSLVVNDSIQGTGVEFVVQGKPFVIPENEGADIGVTVAYNANVDAVIQLSKAGNKINARSQVEGQFLDMASLKPEDRSNPSRLDSLAVSIPADSTFRLEAGKLYTFGTAQFVFKGIKQHVKRIRMKSPIKNAGADYLIVEVSDGKEKERVELKGGKDAIPELAVFQLNGLNYEMEYGAIRIDLPFAVKCRDFQLDRYPGSESPSSFASEVTIIDEERNYTRDQRIFMNNVMDYRGYRFFQSSYEPDESGTRLSVNSDWWGTNITYLGYLMMSIGMILSLIMPGNRMRELNGMIRKSKEKRSEMIRNGMSVLTAVLLAGSMFAQEPAHDHDHDHDHSHDHAAEEHDHSHTGESMEVHAAHSQSKEKLTFRVMSEEHSDEIATLLVQDYSGRIIPMHTLCDQLLRKIHRGNTYKDWNAVQTVMSMHMHPEYWMAEPIIYVSTRGGLRDRLKTKDGYVSYNALVDVNGNFLLLEDYRKAHQKLESRRDEFDKQLIKLAERFEVIQSLFSWRYMNIIPLKSDPAKKWYSPLNISLLDADTSGIKKGIRYLAALDSASADLKVWKDATAALDVLKEFQYSEAGDIAPKKSIIEMEVSYNKMNIFKRSYQMYLIIGVVSLLVFFVGVFTAPTEKKERRSALFRKIITGLSIIVFVYHGYGLYMRWMISGHAPWSNGYEAVVFIAWATMLTGLLFSRKNAVILAGTAILAALMIVVTEMNLMDPEITPLQPVLKSYWLMIHVAIITGSYGPLGISCILGVLNLLLYIFRTKKNGKLITSHINELTFVSEMTMTIGVFMLTIGTFLGGIWANESWGRYWGWDPKETWALVAVLTYAVILHFRYIPGMKGKFLFNAVGMWGYASILFTFFGVNFYLVGLHSYAQGEGLGRIPNSLIITVIIFVIFTAVAAWRNKVYKKQNAFNNEA